MKSIFQVFAGKEIIYSIQVTPKKKSSIISPGEDPYEPMFKKHVSKIGTQSLIFNPVVAMSITNRLNVQNSALVPMQLIYQFGKLIKEVCTEMRNNSKLFVQDPDGMGLVLASNEAIKIVQKMSIFRSMLIISPDYITDTNTGAIEYAIRINVDRTCIGVMREQEALAFVNTIEHLDTSVYTLLVGLTNHIVEMDDKLDRIIQKLNA